MSNERSLLERIERGEVQVNQLGSEGKIIGFVLEMQTPVSKESSDRMGRQIQDFIAQMGLKVPAIVLSGAKLLPVIEVPV